MTRIVILAVLILAVAFIARARKPAGFAKVADVKGGIGSLEGDRQVLAQLRKAGADLSKPTEVNFYLYFNERSNADSAAKHANSALSATVRPGAGGSPWLCFVSGQMVPDENAIHAEAVRLIAIAKQFGGEYDGWEAAVTK